MCSNNNNEKANKDPKATHRSTTFGSSSRTRTRDRIYVYTSSIYILILEPLSRHTVSPQVIANEILLYIQQIHNTQL